jgi:hypothetical protein
MEDHVAAFIALKTISGNEPPKSGEFEINYLHPLQDVQSTRREISDLNLSNRRRPKSGNPAAEWRLRCKRAANIESELRKLGSLAILSVGSLLTFSLNGIVTTPVRYSNSKETLRNSPMYLSLSAEGKRRLTGAQYVNYSSVEDNLRQLGIMLCLAVSDLHDQSLVEAFNKFKLKIVEHAFSSPTSVDEVSETIKSLGKYCQALLLRVPLPEFPLEYLVKENGRILPFEGPLAFINELANASPFHRRKLTYNEARILAQIGNCPRGLSYPSTNQIRESIATTMDIVTTHATSDPEDLSSYKKGLLAVRTAIGARSSDRTHVSLVSSGTSEVSRSQGGRAKILVISARRTTDLPIPDVCELVGKYDQFGEQIVDQATWELFRYHMSRNIYLKNPTLGDIMFVKPSELEISLQKSLNENQFVPRELAKILNLTASKLIRSNGRYEPQCVESFNTIYFTSTKVKYILERPLEVKADVSVESGLKTRLITAPQAAFAHLSQLPANLLREYYSKDPFCRVGFEESDKLWEVLKAFAKKN